MLLKPSNRSRRAKVSMCRNSCGHDPSDECHLLHLQTSLERLGLDATSAVERARSRSLSRVGRKRLRSQGPEAMEIDGHEGSVAPQKRIHSGKSRCCPDPILTLS